MAFKMKRAGMNLRSTTSVSPQLTQLGSPLRQERDDVSVTPNTENPDEKVEFIGAENNAGTENEFEPETPSTGDACEDPNSEACKRYKAHKMREQSDPCYQYAAGGSQSCGPGYTLNPNPTGGDRGSCCMKAGSDATSEENKVLGSYSEPGQPGSATHILNSTEMRRNNRMLRTGSDGDERSIKKADRNVRQAIRRGRQPNENDLAILSGQALGNYDGLNMKQDSSGYRDWFTGNTYKSVQTNPGGEEGQPTNYNERLRETATELSKTGKYKNENDLKAASVAALKEKLRNEGNAGDSRIEAGKYMSDRTRRVAKKYGADMSNLGKYGNSTRTQKEQDYDARKVTKYSNQLKLAVDENGKFDPKNTEMSKKKYDNLKRKITKRNGDNSAFKKKGSPMHMTVNVTKPSYKMGGFGSK